MRLLIINILLLFSTQVWSQSDLGIGLISIDFDDKTVLEFYSDTLATEPKKVIEFFDDRTINSWNIKKLNQQQVWLKPEVLWLDYYVFTFRTTTKSDKWFEVMVNNVTGKTYWIKNNKLTVFKDWEKYLNDMFGIARLSNCPQKIKTKPTENSPDIEYQGTDCFAVKSMKEDWIEIYTPDYCDENFTDSKTPIKSGWIKWRQVNKLMIEYYTTS